MSTRSKLILMLGVLMVVLALVASSSAIAVDDTAPPTTTDDYDGLWHSSDVTVNLTPVDDLSGVAGTFFSFDGVDYLPGTSFLVQALALAANDGEHVVNYYSVDVAGNPETPKSCVVKIDTQKPLTSIYGDDSLWHRQPVLLTLSPLDMGGAGILRTEYKIDGRAWTAGSEATVKAPSTHAWDGVHTVYFRSHDNAGNIELAQNRKVKIDTRGPVCSAPYSASAVQGSYATLKYKVSDALSAQARVTIKVKTTSGSTVKTIELGKRYTNKTLSTRLLCGFAPKTYRFYVYAKDLAGNAQTKTGVNTLTVKPRVLSSIGARVSDSTPAQYTDVTAYCTARDQAGRPLPGVKCTFAWHYKTTTPTESAYTKSNGVASSTRYISGATEGYRVVITITASYRGVVKSTSVSFVPH